MCNCKQLLWLTFSRSYKSSTWLIRHTCACAEDFAPGKRCALCEDPFYLPFSQSFPRSLKFLPSLPYLFLAWPELCLPSTCLLLAVGGRALLQNHTILKSKVTTCISGTSPSLQSSSLCRSQKKSILPLSPEKLKANCWIILMLWFNFILLCTHSACYHKGQCVRSIISSLALICFRKQAYLSTHMALLSFYIMFIRKREVHGKHIDAIHQYLWIAGLYH